MSDDLHYEKVCEVNDIWEGEMDVFDVGENEVLIVHSPGREIRAYSPVCPHAEFPLIDGELENCVLTCSAHLWQFDVLSGEEIKKANIFLRLLKSFNFLVWGNV